MGTKLILVINLFRSSASSSEFKIPDIFEIPQHPIFSKSSRSSVNENIEANQLTIYQLPRRHHLLPREKRARRYFRSAVWAKSA